MCVLIKWIYEMQGATIKNVIWNFLEMNCTKLQALLSRDALLHVFTLQTISFLFDVLNSTIRIEKFV